MDNTQHLESLLELFELKKIILAIFAIFIMYVSVKLIKNLSKKVENDFPSYRLLTLQLTTIIVFAIYIFGTLAIIMGILRPSEKLLLAIGGSAAVAIGFSLKDLVSSIVAGVTLLFDRPFQVGDRVQFNDTYGEIVNIGLRAVRLTTLDDNLVTIPNSKFMSEVVSSGNAGALDMMVVCDFHISVMEDTERVKKIVHEVIVTSRFAYLKKPVIVTINEVIVAQRLALKISGKAYVLDVRFEKQFQSDIVTRVSKMFIQNNIKRPGFDYKSDSPT
jgi:small-conductance mechanosensitive channel